MSSFIFHFVSEWRVTCIRVDTTGRFTSALTDCGNDGLPAASVCVFHSSHEKWGLYGESIALTVGWPVMETLSFRTGPMGLISQRQTLNTQRENTVLTPIGSVVSALLTLLWPSPLPLCNCLPTWWKCSRLGFCHSEILVNPSANMCCVREHEYDMLISLILKDFTMIHLKEFLALGTHSYIPTVFVFFFCEIHVNGEHVKQDFIELWLYGFIRLRIQW